MSVRSPLLIIRRVPGLIAAMEQAYRATSNDDGP
jgi:hypothetical protein